MEDFLKANYSDETIKKSPHLGEVDKVTFHIDGLKFLRNGFFEKNFYIYIGNYWVPDPDSFCIGTCEIT